MTQDTMPEANTLEWWKMQAERYKAETEEVTNAAREAAAKHAAETEGMKAEHKAAIDNLAATQLLTQQLNDSLAADVASARAALQAHRQALADILAGLGPALSRAGALLQG